MEQRFKASNSLWVVSNCRRLLLTGDPPSQFASGLADAPSDTFDSEPSAPNAPPAVGSTGFQALDPNVVIIMVVLFFALICAALVNSLMRCMMRRRTRAANARAVFIGRGGDDSSEQGLDANTLASLPVLTFKSSEDSKPAEVDCTICLSEFTENERLRLLPMCSHVFHLDCIDMWLLSHSSCPICRDGIKAANEFALKVDQDSDSGELMILTLDQDGHPSVRSTASATHGVRATELGESIVNVRAELKRDRSWHGLSDARLSSSRRSISLGNLGSSFREGSMAGRVGSSRSSLRAALSAILTTSGDKNPSGRWLGTSSSFPSAGTAAPSTRSSSAERPEGTGGSLVANEQLRARSSPAGSPSH